MIYNKRPLPGVGFEYLDINLKEMSNDELREFGKVLIEDNVLLLRNQDLDNPDDLARIAHAIGRTWKSGKYFNLEDHPDIGRVTNQRDENGNKLGIFADHELDWHSNGNARETGRECCVILYCVRPGIDSITSFADTRQAYIDLPDDIKAIVEDVDCEFRFIDNSFYKFDENDPEIPILNNNEYYPQGLVKPLVYSHPFSGEKGLYFAFHSIAKMWSRSGRELDEQWLREYLMKHVFQEKYIYHHNDWKNGDLIFMDQFHSIHRRNEVKGDRYLHRITVDYSKSLRQYLIDSKKI